jgi:3-oxoacyl-[acyl-carrier protein] reductase
MSESEQSRCAARVALITGAGSGIGRAIAAMLACRASAWDLFLVGRRSEPLAETRELARAAQADAGRKATRIEWLTGDVGSRETAEGMVDACMRTLGRLDVLVNNAGLAPLKPIGDTTPELIEEVFRVNAIGPAIAIARAWKHLRAAGGSSCIVNISTMGTHDPFPGFFAYAASKASVNLMAASCAKEGMPAPGSDHPRVRAFSIAPGAVETSMLRGLFADDVIPASACLHSEDVARIVIECIEGDRDHQNGQTIYVAKS